MIDARELAKKLKLPALPAEDEAEVRRLGAEIVLGIGKDYDGRPFNIRIPAGDGEEQWARTYRIACALQRRFQVLYWIVQLETIPNAFGFPEAHSLWFAIDPAVFRAASTASATASAPSSLRSLHDELSSMFGGSSAAASTTLPAKPELSVLLGTYNRLPLLKEAIASIRASVRQSCNCSYDESDEMTRHARLCAKGTPISYEIIVVDGGSTDGSRAWLAAQPDVLLVAERRLEGAVHAFNQAFQISRGDFIANWNDDVRDTLYRGKGALAEGVEYLKKHAEAGQVAFALPAADGDGDWVVNEVHPGRARTTYANHGVVRRSIAEKIARITGGFWPTCYHTYAGDCEHSAWVWRLGYEVASLPNLRIADARPDDGLRARNQERFAVDSKRMYARWPAASFKPDGPLPRVTEAELARYREAIGEKTEAKMGDRPSSASDDALESYVALAGFPEPQEERRLRKVAPLLRALDPVDGAFPKRAEKLGSERVLHVHINGKTAVDQQEGLVRALQELGSGGYEMVRWPDFSYEERQKGILEAAARLSPTFVFMQLQAPDVVSVETVRKLREISPGVTIATWCGDIADCNSPFNVDWQVELGRAVDLVLHSSLTHARALRGAGIHNAGFLNIGFDDHHYVSAPGGESRFDISFLGNRYGQGDPFSSSYRRKSGEIAHDAELRDEVVFKMREAFGERFGLFGAGWGFGVESVPVTRSHEVYQQSKIGLSISLDNQLECYSSDRIFRILGCGALLLVKRFPKMSVLGLEHEKNCLIFDTTEEAVNLARWILGYKVGGEDGHAVAELKRDKVALAGAELARQNHTWNIRMRELQVYLDAVRGAS